jgi:hypothetical protein
MDKALSAYRQAEDDWQTLKHHWFHLQRIRICGAVHLAISVSR